MEQYYIVRTDRAGVFFGKIKETKGMSSVIMTDVRKIHYWEGACAVEQISQDGIGGDSRITMPIPQMEISAPIQVIPCTDKSTKILKEFKVWKV